MLILDNGYKLEKSLYFIWTMFKVQFTLLYLFIEIILQHATTKVVPAETYST